MIKVEGFKAFIGTMKIIPKNPRFPEQSIKGEWLYKPDTDCWYCNGNSYMSCICEIEEDLTANLK